MSQIPITLKWGWIRIIIKVKKLDADPSKSKKWDPDPHWSDTDPQPCFMHWFVDIFKVKCRTSHLNSIAYPIMVAKLDPGSRCWKLHFNVKNTVSFKASLNAYVLILFAREEIVFANFRIFNPIKDLDGSGISSKPLPFKNENGSATLFNLFVYFAIKHLHPWSNFHCFGSGFGSKC